MMYARLRPFLRVERLAMGLAGFSFGLFASVLSNWLYEYGQTLWPWLVGVAIVSGLVGLALFLRQREGIEVALRTPLTIRWPQEGRIYARRGWVGFAPLYTPQRGPEWARLSPEEQKRILQEERQAIEALDFDRLQIEASNLAPTLHAIQTHAERLEHCWLLGSVARDPAAPGSLPYARLIAEYLRQRQGLRCEFHYGPEYAISLEDDALVLKKTYDRVRQVFDEAARLGIPPREMIADITTGIRSMPFGMILACLGAEQDVEFVGTHYDEQGRPKRGDLYPIIFGFEPQLQ